MIQPQTTALLCSWSLVALSSHVIIRKSISIKTVRKWYVYYHAADNIKKNIIKSTDGVMRVSVDWMLITVD